MPGAAEHLDRILAEARGAIAGAESTQALAEIRAGFLGKKGSVSTVLRGIGDLAGAERAAVGKAANVTKGEIEALVAKRREALEGADQERVLAEHRLDVTLPGFAPPRGHLHPTSHIEREMCAFFTQMGYSIEDGPEVETDWNNFGGLNFPEDHPARDMQDTFFVPGGNVLRTHTSNVQIRAMTGQEPPFRFVCPGRVYRHDLDGTHYPMFHQIEAVCVDEQTTFADLKGTLFAFARHLFGESTDIRFRAHFFPFTEPSAELDIGWGGRWLEWGGCGMIHPRVLLNCGIDPERYQGFAFGMGIDRTAMIRWDIPNIQLLFDGDVRTAEQF
ncbi:MAG: phenylalanine--tRNA ligase subunit alpha [Deltaproteobacteria bacterium]|jgi:phenylalanyl-tRNA synthetase alpha chain|nr:phenylalanine--tRNA ligase subunit alpha [Deltaproteobacteria bacterium]